MTEDDSSGFGQQTDPAGHEPTRRRRGSASIWVGIVLILVGILFILRVTQVISLSNWWALFILIPAFASLGSALDALAQSHGHYTKSVSGGLTGFLFMGTVAALFIFDLDWGRFWPVFIVIAGISVLSGAYARRA